jgi:hypothetical protein
MQTLEDPVKTVVNAALVRIACQNLATIRVASQQVSCHAVECGLEAKSKESEMASFEQDV